MAQGAHRSFRRSPSRHAASIWRILRSPPLRDEHHGALQVMSTPAPAATSTGTHSEAADTGATVGVINWRGEVRIFTKKRKETSAQNAAEYDFGYRRGYDDGQNDGWADGKTKVLQEVLWCLSEDFRAADCGCRPCMVIRACRGRSPSFERFGPSTMWARRRQ